MSINMKKTIVSIVSIFTICLFINDRCGFSQEVQTYAGERSFAAFFTSGGCQLFNNGTTTTGTETYEYYLKDGSKIKHGTYKFESMYFKKGESNKSSDQLKITIVGNFVNDKPEGEWQEKMVGKWDGYPFKSVGIFSFANGLPEGVWMVADTAIDTDGTRKFETTSYTISSNRMKNYQYKNTFRNQSSSRSFDENGLLHDGSTYIHGIEPESDRGKSLLNKTLPELNFGLLLESNGNLSCIDKCSINLVSSDKSSTLASTGIEFTQFVRFHPTYQIALGDEGMQQFPSFTFLYFTQPLNAIIQMTDGEYWDDFLNSQKGMPTEELAMAFYNYWAGNTTFGRQNYEKAKEYYTLSQSLCKDCVLKDVINAKLAEVKKYIFE